MIFNQFYTAFKELTKKNRKVGIFGVIKKEAVRRIISNDILESLDEYVDTINTTDLRQSKLLPHIQYIFSRNNKGEPVASTSLYFEYPSKKDIINFAKIQFRDMDKGFDSYYFIKKLNNGEELTNVLDLAESCYPLTVDRIRRFSKTKFNYIGFKYEFLLKVPTDYQYSKEDVKWLSDQKK